MAGFDFDLFVMGAGSAGVAGGRRAGGYGARVAICEESRIGGTCVNRGCIPKKMLVYASHFHEEFEDAQNYGWTVGETRHDWSTLMANVNAELDRLNGIYDGLLEGADVTYLPEHGALVDNHTVRVGGETYTAETIWIATGGWPVVPGIPGAEHAITSNEAFLLPEKPDKIVIVGGGYIACEFAGILNGLGVETVQLYRGEMFLRGFDDDLRTCLAEEMRLKGIDLRFEDNVEAIEKSGERLIAQTTRSESIAADQIMFATGRAPNTHGIGLVEAGVELNRMGAVVVDQWSRTNIPNIYAIGDCTDRINLTPVAIHEGRCLADTLYNDNAQMPDHRDVPTAVFTQPEMGTVGMTEAEARAEFGDITIFRTRFRPLKHTITKRVEKVLMKLIVDAKSDRVVGCHMLGPSAGEVVQILGICVKAGVTKTQFDATMAIHPTSAEEFVTLYEPVLQVSE